MEAFRTKLCIKKVAKIKVKLLCLTFYLQPLGIPSDFYDCTVYVHCTLNKSVHCKGKTSMVYSNGVESVNKWPQINCFQASWSWMVVRTGNVPSVD